MSAEPGRLPTSTEMMLFHCVAGSALNARALKVGLRYPRSKAGKSLSASGSFAVGRLCCKSRFAQVVKNSKGRRCGFRVNMGGTSSPRAKLTGDFGNAIEAIRIGDFFSVHVFAKNSRPCNFRLLQHNRPEALIG